jgi:uncharacterized protein
MEITKPFMKKQYINLETFRKNGAGVRTPVWFWQDGETLYVLTGAGSGKVKRIHNNGCVNVAPSKMDGTPVGPWLTAQAREVTDPATIEKVDHMMDKKYGLMKKLFRLGGNKEQMPSAFLEIKVLG